MEAYMGTVNPGVFFVPIALFVLFWLHNERRLREENPITIGLIQTIASCIGIFGLMVLLG